MIVGDPVCARLEDDDADGRGEHAAQAEQAIVENAVRVVGIGVAGLFVARFAHADAAAAESAEFAAGNGPSLATAPEFESITPERLEAAGFDPTIHGVACVEGAGHQDGGLG